MKSIKQDMEKSVIQKNEIIVTNKFLLGRGKDGIFSDIKILVKSTNTSSLRRGTSIENEDENLLKEIEAQLENNWIKGYEKKSIFLEIVILNVGIDEEGRRFAVENAVNGVMHKALPKIGIAPPQIFG